MTKLHKSIKVHEKQEGPKLYKNVNIDEKSKLYKPREYNPRSVGIYKPQPPTKVTGELYKPIEYKPNEYDPNNVRELGPLHEYDHIYDVFPPDKPKQPKKPSTPPPKNPPPETPQEKTPPTPEPSSLPYDSLGSVLRTFEVILQEKKPKQIEMITDAFG